MKKVESDNCNATTTRRTIFLFCVQLHENRRSKKKNETMHYNITSNLHIHTQLTLASVNDMTEITKTVIVVVVVGVVGVVVYGEQE